MNATMHATEEQHFMLQHADWKAYEGLLRIVGEQRIFVTYNRGRIELMSPSWEHDNRAEIIGQLIRILAEEFGQPLRGGGSTTFRREDLDRGLEPDKCFYLRNEALIRGKKTIDLSVDPPPDLCVEVEISRRLLDRIDIYAGLGVPELWRDDGKRLNVCELSAERMYVDRDRSISFPLVSVAVLNEFLESASIQDDTSWSRQVRRAIQQMHR